MANRDAPLVRKPIEAQPYLVSVASTDIVTWDIKTGHVLNYQPLRPAVPAGRPQTMNFLRDGTELEVSIVDDDGDDGEPVTRCAHYTIDPFGHEAVATSVTVKTPCVTDRPVAMPRNTAGRTWAIAGTDIVISQGAGGGDAMVLASPRRESFSRGAVSLDAQFVAQVSVSGTGADIITRVVARSLRTGTIFPERRFRGDYGRLQWFDGGRFMLRPLSNEAVASEFCQESGALLPTLVVDVSSGEIVDQMATLRQLTPLGPAGAMIGIGPDCSEPTKLKSDTVYIRAANRDWQPVQFAKENGRTVDRLAARPDGLGLAVLTSASMEKWQITFVDLEQSGKVRNTFVSKVGFDRRDERGRIHWGFGISRDSSLLIVGLSEKIYCIKVEDGEPGCFVTDLPEPFQAPTFFSADRNTVIVGASTLPDLYIRDLRSGTVKYMAAEGLQSGGVLPGRNLMWSVAADGTTRFYDQQAMKRILTSFRLKDGGYFTIDSTGRYDTNQGADSATVRWRLSDRPWESLPPQMFMRDRYEPDLLPRRLDCTMARDCDTVFRELSQIRVENWALPKVRIVSAAPGPRPGTARIDVEATSTTSGLRDLRLLRDGRLVAQWPVPREGRDALLLPPDRPGTVRHSFVVPLPLTRGDSSVAFSAYGFSAQGPDGDGRKGETSDRVRLVPIAIERPRPRAFVLTIGIDRYAIPGKNLGFAAADASALAKALESIDGYNVHRMTLVADSSKVQATKALIRAAFGLLTGAPGNWAAQLRRAGIDPTGFSAATPDDIVIISWSGHGIVNKDGKFALVPSDARLGADGDIDDSSLVSSDELAGWLRPLDAGETALIIDACHSAASIAAGGFKPGPMGDAGLGQLAFDKGIRVLAATQADDVALESRQKGLGLLTATLIEQGLGGKAPGTSEDGWVRLDAVLRDTAASLPRLMAEERARAEAANAAAWPPLLVVADSATPPPRVQVPAVFDFTGSSSPAWLAARAQ